MENNIRFGPMLAALAIFAIILVVVSCFSFNQNHDTLDTMATAQLSTVFKGIFFQKQAALRDDFLLLFGSSEFSSVVDTHPANVFANKPTGFKPFIIGRGGTQSIVHFLDIAALGEDLIGRKVACIISPQWFDVDGIGDYFPGRFSLLHAYEFAFGNAPLSDSLRKKAAGRLWELKDSYSNYLDLTIAIRSLAGDNPMWRWIYQIIKPLGNFNLNLHRYADVIQSYFLSRQYGGSLIQPPEQPAELPWQEMMEKAEQSAAAEATNNPYGIYDSYYDKYIKDNYQELKDSAKDGSFAISPEYQDFQILLDALQELKVDPLFFIVPVNGSWYDYVGFPTDGRRLYYERVRNMIEAKGFKVADFSSHEYEKYFLRDTMHLGWKGWVYVDEALDQHYKGLYK